MKKIKNFMANNFTELKESMKAYPATYVLTFIATIVLAITYENNIGSQIISETVFLRTIWFYLCSIFVIWFGEIVFTKWIYKIIVYATGIGTGALFNVGLLYVKDAHIHFKEENLRYGIGFVLATMIMCIYACFKKKRVNSYKYALDLFQNLFNCNILYGVLNVGIIIVTYIFIILILSGHNETLLTRVCILTMGLVYIPLNIMAFTKKKAHITTFITNLVKFVLVPITLAAMLVVYMFIVKCIVTRTFPIVYIFKCVFVIFILGMPCLIMAKNFKDDNKFYKLCTQISSIAFIPFIAMQIYTIAVMCRDYGITTSRYCGIVVLIIEICVIICAIIYNKKDIMEMVLIVAAVLSVTSCMTPLNYRQVTINSQIKILEKLWPKGKKLLELKDKDRAAEAYEYVESSLEAADYLPEYLRGNPAKTEVEAYKYDKYDEYGNIVKEIKLTCHNYDKVKLSKYKKIKQVVSVSSDDIVDAEDVEDVDNKKQQKKYEKFVLELVKKHGKKLEEKNVYKLDDNTDIAIMNLSIEYYDKDGKIEIIFFHVDAIEFEKKK